MGSGGKTTGQSRNLIWDIYFFSDLPKFIQQVYARDCKCWNLQQNVFGSRFQHLWSLISSKVYKLSWWKPGHKRHNRTNKLAMKFLYSILMTICFCFYRSDVCVMCNGEDYAGFMDHTASGLECQRWDLNYPHVHKYQPEKYVTKFIFKQRTQSSPRNLDACYWIF